MPMNEQRALLLHRRGRQHPARRAAGRCRSAELGAAHDRWHAPCCVYGAGARSTRPTAADAVRPAAGRCGCCYAVAYHAALAIDRAVVRCAGLHVVAVILRANPLEDVAKAPNRWRWKASPSRWRRASCRWPWRADAAHRRSLRRARRRPPARVVARPLAHQGHRRTGGAVEIGDERHTLVPPPDRPRSTGWPTRRPVAAARCVTACRPNATPSLAGRTRWRDLGRRFAAAPRLVSLLGIAAPARPAGDALRLDLAGHYGGGVCFAIGAGPQPHGLVHAVAQGLDCRWALTTRSCRWPCHRRPDGQRLVILDNFEQISRLAEYSLGRWLDRAVEARFLVTSREVLGCGARKRWRWRRSLWPMRRCFLDAARHRPPTISAADDDEGAIRSSSSCCDGCR